MGRVICNGHCCFPQEVESIHSARWCLTQGMGGLALVESLCCHSKNALQRASVAATISLPNYVSQHTPSANFESSMPRWVQQSSAGELGTKGSNTSKDSPAFVDAATSALQDVPNSGSQVEVGAVALTRLTDQKQIDPRLWVGY